ncbi:UPF0158 family protein [Clostridium sp.]|uniref:UPF0158 family protein n=1 Tax=Clostridium sp. TaxID=1506 RepID=UPI001A4F8060|nr:UPF0158 family protein [Clostridium sp.]MBK5241811.1 hypothetical protein [Clostridium sp.]
MKLLSINMEAFIETISSVDDDLGKSFLDTDTGEAIYIPSEVCLALENETLKEDTFDNWLKEFVSVAILISEDADNRYIRTPVINDDFYIGEMKIYANLISDPDLKVELQKALKSDEPIKRFKHLLMDKQDEIDKWYKYEDNSVYEFVIAWLKSNSIELKHLN